jgi:hypothetical protein
MLIGITYDLREDYAREGYDEEETAEFDRIETIAAIELALSSLGHSTDRIGHPRALIHRLGRGDRWDLVFNIGEGMDGFGREALVPALLDTYKRINADYPDCAQPGQRRSSGPPGASESLSNVDPKTARAAIFC